MKYFVFSFVLFLTSWIEPTQAFPYFNNPQPKIGNKKTDIRNKNVNIIVNMDPKQVASELWNVLKEHLSKKSPHEAAETVREIEDAITPVVAPTRRGGVIPVKQVAGDLEGIVRRLIRNENPRMDAMELETVTKDISSDLMTSLQSFWNKVDVNRRQKKKPARPDLIENMLKLVDSQLEESDEKSEERGEFVMIPVRIMKNDLVEALLEL